jgi:hypothetical protein
MSAVALTVAVGAISGSVAAPALNAANVQYFDCASYDLDALLNEDINIHVSIFFDFLFGNTTPQAVLDREAAVEAVLDACGVFHP